MGTRARALARGAAPERRAARVPGRARARGSGRRDEAPIEREEAVDVLSGALAAFTGVDRRPRVRRWRREARVRGRAPGAGPAGVRRPARRARRAGALHIDADGWVAWGAVPTDRPLGEASDSSGAVSSRCGASSPAAAAIPVRLRTHGARHPRVRARDARCEPGRARAAARAGHRVPSRRPSRRGPPHRRRLTLQGPADGSHTSSVGSTAMAKTAGEPAQPRASRSCASRSRTTTSATSGTTSPRSQ